MCVQLWVNKQRIPAGLAGGGRQDRARAGRTALRGLGSIKTSIRILAWNILQGGGPRTAQILETIGGHVPDILVLSEYCYGPGGVALEQQLELAGYTYRSVCARGPNHDGITVLVASKIAFTPEYFEGQIVHPKHGDFSHRLVRARFPGFDVVGAYFPLCGGKQAVFDQIWARSPDFLFRPTLLIGDINTALSPDDAQGVAPLPGEERLTELLAAGWIDAWRSRNATAREFTWFSRQAENGFRIDQALASPSFDRGITAIRYSHRERTERISDHSALIVDLAMPL